MNAIAGYWSLDGRPDAALRCERMLKSQAIYGPLDPVVASAGDVAIGQRLFGLSPDRRKRVVASAASGALLVADARLDNREELYEALGIAGGEAAGLSDAALILRAMERWSEAVVDRLQGDFAFAYWDARQRRLLLARDFIGQRPLHYCRRDNFFAFASMPKGLHALPEVPPAPNRATAANFLALLPEDASESFFEGIEKVRAGELVTVSRDGVKTARWWQPDPTVLRLARPEDYAEGLRAHFDRAVAVRLRDAGPQPGTHLSGGLDSSSVAATAARVLAATGGRITAFTAVPREGFEASETATGFGDERAHAASVAAMYPNMDHVLVHNGGSPLAGLDRNFFLYERPLLNLCNAVWMHRILDAAKERGLTVLLSGAYGNFNFSYDGMQMLGDLLPKGRLLKLARESVALMRNGMRPGRIAAHALGPYLPAALWQAYGRLRHKRRMLDYSAISPGAVAELGIREQAEARDLDLSNRPRRATMAARLRAMRRIDAGNFNKGQLAGWGIDVRDPTADRRLTEFCLSIPADQYLRNGVRRALARTAFADRLPPLVIDETRNGHQAADWQEGVMEARGEMGEELERIGASRAGASTIDVAMLRGLVEAMPDVDWQEAGIARKYRLALLRGASTGHFIRKAAGENS